MPTTTEKKPSAPVPQNTNQLPKELFEYLNPDAKAAKQPTYDQNWVNTNWTYEPGAGDILGGQWSAVGNMDTPGGPVQEVKTGDMVDPKTGKRIPYATWEAMNQQKLNEKKAWDNLQKGLDPSGKPIAPEYFSMIDPQTGMLYSQYQYKPGLIDASTLEGYQAIKNEALRTGPSAWANIMYDKQKAEEAAARDAAIKQSMQGQAQARADMAMRGGLRGGTQERLAQKAQKDILAARQGVAQQGIGQRFGIATEDEERRMKMLPMFAEAEGKIATGNLDATNMASRYNIEAALKEKAQKDAAAMKAYEEQMRAWAAEKEAEATRNSGGGGGGGGMCFITTAICEKLGLPDDHELLNTFRKFRDDHMGGKKSKELQEYYRVAPKIVEQLKEDSATMHWVLIDCLLPAYGLIKLNKIDEARDLYTDMVKILKQKYKVF